MSIELIIQFALEMMANMSSMKLMIIYKEDIFLQLKPFGKLLASMSHEKHPPSKLYLYIYLSLRDIAFSNVKMVHQDFLY